MHFGICWAKQTTFMSVAGEHPIGPVDPLEKDKLEKELTTQKQSQMWERWVLAARGDARIDVVGQKPARKS